MLDLIETAREELYRQLATASAALKTFPRLSNGLTPDAVKFSPEYRAAKLAVDQAFTALRAFNTRHPRRRR